jgi:hypothetical protein
MKNSAIVEHKTSVKLSGNLVDKTLIELASSVSDVHIDPDKCTVTFVYEPSSSLVDHVLIEQTIREKLD